MTEYVYQCVDRRCRSYHQPFSSTLGPKEYGAATGGAVKCPACGRVLQLTGVAAHSPETALEPRDDTEDRAIFTETPRGYEAREKWARRYDDLNGAPESDDDR